MCPSRKYTCVCPKIMTSDHTTLIPPSPDKGNLKFARLPPSFPKRQDYLSHTAMAAATGLQWQVPDGHARGAAEAPGFVHDVVPVRAPADGVVADGSPHVGRVHTAPARDRDPRVAPARGAEFGAVRGTVALRVHVCLPRLARRLPEAPDVRRRRPRAASRRACMPSGPRTPRTSALSLSGVPRRPFRRGWWTFSGTTTPTKPPEAKAPARDRRSTACSSTRRRRGPTSHGRARNDAVRVGSEGAGCRVVGCRGEGLGGRRRD